MTFCCGAPPPNHTFGAKDSFLSEMVQRGPDGPKRVPIGQKHLSAFMLVAVYKYLRVHSCWLRFVDVLMCVWGGLGQGPLGQLYNIGLT